MSQKFHVIVNNETVLEYDKTGRLPGHQRNFLDKIDQDLDAGFKLGDELIESPDDFQRAQYIAQGLLAGMQSENKELVSAACAWLSTRQPDLNTIRYHIDGDDISLRLICDE